MQLTSLIPDKSAFSAGMLSRQPNISTRSLEVNSFEANRFKLFNTSTYVPSQNIQ